MADLPKPGDHTPIRHDCTGLGGMPMTHEADVLVTSVDQCVVGPRIRAVACDGRRIEWIADEAEGGAP